MGEEYPFDGDEEERRCLQWMVARLRDHGSKKDREQRQMVEDLTAELKARLVTLDEAGARLADEWYEMLWDRFIFATHGVWPQEADESFDPRFVWGQWELTDAHEITLGYSKQLVATLIPKGGGSAVHSYSKPPRATAWKLTPIAQKGVTYYVGKAKVAEIDAVCSVPQLPAEIDSEEAGLRVLDARRGDQEWQRRVEGQRILSIRNFIGGSDNIIANAVILYAPQHEAVTVTASGNVKIDFGRFVRKQGNRWLDHHGKNDLRPVWLIDGQHRTRGLAQSPDGIDLEVPIILFPPDFSLANSAKIFAEINTLQKKLSPLHTLFMQHRFHIPSPVAKRDFRKPWNPRHKSTWDSRANHLAYECAAYLTSNEDGPLKGRIRMLDQNPPRIPIIQATQWVDFSRFWYLEGGIYAPDTPETQEEINEEVENFFRALVATSNHGGWPDGRERWSPHAKNKALIQRQGPSQALLRVYPTAWSIARDGADGNIASEQDFLRALKPLRWADWLDSRLDNTFGGSGERPRTALRMWIEAALLHGKTYPLEEVMSEELRSEPGRGMLAPPGPSKISIAGRQRWPEPGKPVVLVAAQPNHTLSSSKWTIFDSEGHDRSPDNQTVIASRREATFELEYEHWMRAVHFVDIRVDWFNTVSPPGKATIQLRRPTP